MHDNGSWGGIIGDVANNKADLTIEVSVVYERSLVTQMSRVYFADPVTFMFKKPGPPPKWQIILRPFPSKYNILS